MSVYEYVIMRLGGEAKVRQLAADRELQVPLEQLVQEIGIETARVILLMPNAENNFKAFIGGAVGVYHLATQTEGKH